MKGFDFVDCYLLKYVHAKHSQMTEAFNFDTRHRMIQFVEDNPNGG